MVTDSADRGSRSLWSDRLLDFSLKSLPKQCKMAESSDSFEPTIRRLEPSAALGGGDQESAEM